MPKLTVKKPHITEKAVRLSNEHKYVFVVDKKASRVEVKKIIESMYGVKVTNVNMINLPGKPKRMRTKVNKTGGVRKAIVQIKEGQKIDIIPQ